MSMRDQNRKKLREFAHNCITRIMHVVLISEITAKTREWYGSARRNSAVVIHGRQTAIILCRAWKQKWIDEGQKKWTGNRVTAVTVNIIRLVTTYQPLGSGTGWARGIPRELEEQVVRSTSKEWLLIGGDHNSHMVRREEEAFNRGVCGRHGDDPEASARNIGGHIPLWLSREALAENWEFINPKGGRQGVSLHLEQQNETSSERDARKTG